MRAMANLLRRILSLLVKLNILCKGAARILAWNWSGERNSPAISVPDCRGAGRHRAPTRGAPTGRASVIAESAGVRGEGSHKGCPYWAWESECGAGAGVLGTHRRCNLKMALSEAVERYCHLGYNLTLKGGLHYCREMGYILGGRRSRLRPRRPSSGSSKTESPETSGGTSYACA